MYLSAHPLDRYYIELTYGCNTPCIELREKNTPGEKITFGGLVTGFEVKTTAKGKPYGVLSMARSMMPDSAGSQFFIMTSDSPHLDGQYAAFGKVLEGMDVADAIVSVKRNMRDKPLEPQVMKSIRVETFGQTYPFEQM